jgi:hypothetical protein
MISHGASHKLYFAVKPAETRTEDIRLLNVAVIGEGAYKYGLPSVGQAKEILREHPGLSEEAFSALEETGVLEDVYSYMSMYHMLLNTINADDAKMIRAKNSEKTYTFIVLKNEGAARGKPPLKYRRCHLLISPTGRIPM